MNIRMRNPRAGHGMTGGPIFLMLLGIPLLAPIFLPMMILQWLGFSAPPGAVQAVVTLAWVILLAAFWHWMKWSWWIPGIWLAALGLLFLAGRYC